MVSLVWERLGDPDNVIEPFCGSAAFLLARPHAPRVETLNDYDCMVANFWRATQHAPEAVAEHADGPVNEADLHARHRWLVLSDTAAEFRGKMRTDPHYYDAQVAGWWVWGACAWIGGGWCQERRPVIALPGSENGPGVHGAADVDHKRPLIAEPESQHGRGVHGEAESLWQSRPRLEGEGSSSPGNGVHYGRPQLADAYSLGRGVHGGPGLSQKRVFLGHEDNQGVHAQSDGGPLGHGANAWVQDFSGGTCAARRLWLLDWFNRLRDRLRNVRVCCGDWIRVCESESVTTRLGVTGIFLDPPYPRDNGSRADSLYATDGAAKSPEQIRDEVLAYCKERGGDPKMRLAVCGYDTDGYAALEALGWDVVAWKAHGGYGNRTAKGKANARRERIWFSPHCQRDRMLFD